MTAIERNNVRVCGVGCKAMIFAHGFGCDQNVWRAMVPAFEPDYQVVLFDHVGAGASDASQYDVTKYDALQGYADDLLDICHELGIEDAIFVGHSVGATIGMLAAIKAPRTFEKLVFVAPSPCFINDEHYTGGFSRSDIEELLALMDENFFGWSANIAPLIMGNADKPQFAVELTASFCRTQPEIAKHFARVTFLSDTREQLRLLRQPALILQCARDAIAPEAVGHFMHRQLQRSTLVLMQAEGHCPHMSAPEETIAEIKRFLQDAT